MIIMNNNCKSPNEYLPLSLNEKYHKLIRFFEKNKL